MEAQVSELKQENAGLSAQILVVKQLGADADKKLRNAMPIIRRAAEINQDDPAVYLKRALDVMDRLGTIRPEEAKRFLSRLLDPRAVEISPNDPAAYVKRALDVMDRLGTNTRPDEVRPLAEMASDETWKQRAAAAETVAIRSKASAIT